MAAKQIFLLSTLLVAPFLVWAGSFDLLVNGNDGLAQVVNSDTADVNALTTQNAPTIAEEITNDLTALEGHILNLLDVNEGLSPTNNLEDENALANGFALFSQAIGNYTQALTAKQPILSAQGQQGAIYNGLQNAQNDYTDLYRYEVSLLLDSKPQDKINKAYTYGLVAFDDAQNFFQQS